MLQEFSPSGFNYEWNFIGFCWWWFCFWVRFGGVHLFIFCSSGSSLLHSWAFSSCGKQEPLSSCCVQASHLWWLPLLQSTGPWDSEVVAHGFSCPVAHGISVPGPRIEPMFPALQVGFLTTGPPGESYVVSFSYLCCYIFNNNVLIL